MRKCCLIDVGLQLFSLYFQIILEILFFDFGSFRAAPVRGRHATFCRSRKSRFSSYRIAYFEAAGGSERAEYWIPVGFCSILRSPDFRLASWLAGPRELTTLLTPAWLPGCMAAWLAGCLAKTFPNLTYFSKESDGCECVEPIGICTWHTCSRNTPI